MIPLRRQIKREAADSWRAGYPLVVVLGPGDEVAIRRKRSRTTYHLSLETLYDVAAALAEGAVLVPAAAPLLRLPTSPGREDRNECRKTS